MYIDGKMLLSYTWIGEAWGESLVLLELSHVKFRKEYKIFYISSDIYVSYCIDKLYKYNCTLIILT